MDNQNLMPHQAQPISRITSGQLPAELAELAELALCAVNGTDTSVLPLGTIALATAVPSLCSYDGDDAE